MSTTNLPLDLGTLHSTYALCQPPIFPWILAHFIQHMHCVNRQSSLGSWHTSFNICTVSTTNLPLDLDTLHSTYALCQPPIFPWILAHFIQHMHCVNHQSSLGSWHTSFSIMLCVNRQSSLGSWHTSFNICTVSTTNLPLDLGTLHSTYVTRSTEMMNKSGHVKSGKSTSKSIGDGLALKY